MSHFGIGDTSKIIELLRNNIYKYPIQTLVQEYICNARDAHRESGQDKPIKIQIPTYEDCTFAVRDFAQGLSPERLENVFIKYGATTKKDDNGQTGGFGIGAKSAWAYTDKFTITSIHEGTERVYEARIDDRNDGVLEMISEGSTTKPSGTKVSIKIKQSDIAAFNKAVIRATHFWRFNGESVETSIPLFDETSLSPLVQYNKSSFMYRYINNTNVLGNANVPSKSLVIDGIPYEIDSSLFNHSKKISSFFSNMRGASDYYSQKFVLVPNGKVRVAASREGLSADKENVKVIEDILEQEMVSIQQRVQREFAAVKTFQDFADAHLKNIYWSTGKTETYQDTYTFNTDSESFRSSVFGNIDLFYCDTTRKGNLKRTKAHSLQLSDFDNIYVPAVGENKGKTNLRIKTALTMGRRIFVAGETVLDEYQKTIIGKEEKCAEAWKTFSGDFNFKTLDEFPLPVKEKSDQARKVAARKAKTEVAVYSLNYYDSRMPRTVVNTASNETKHVYYNKTNKSLKGVIQGVMKFNARYTSSETVFCGLGIRDIAKVVDNKNFQTFEEYVKDYQLPEVFYQRWLVNDISHYHLNSHAAKYQFVAKQVKDPKFRQIFSLWEKIGEIEGTVLRIPNVLQHSFDEKYTAFKSRLSQKWEEMNSYIENYPLFTSVELKDVDKHKDDLVMYLNAKYEYMQKQSEQLSEQ